MEITCLFCSSPVSLLRPVLNCNDNSSYRQLFDLISFSLSVEDEITSMWDFAVEGLPFCGGCNDKVSKFSDLQKQLNSIQIDLAMLLEEVKSDVRNAAKRSRSRVTASAPESSTRFDQFRQQVLSSGEVRRICSHRVERITGMANSDASSMTSWDDLSVDADAAAEVPGQEFKPIVDTERVALMPWLVTQNQILTTSSESGDDFVNELLQDAENPNRVTDKPIWVETEDRVTFGYVRVIIPKVEDGTTVWKCCAEDCTYEFENKSKKYPRKAMGRHIELTHYPSRECPGCGTTFETAIAMRSHDCTVAKPKERCLTKRCRKCSAVFENLSLLKRHNCPGKKTSKDQRTNVQDNNVAVSETEDASPNPSHSDEPPTPEEEPVTPKSGNRIFQCYICSRTLSSKATLQRHVELHTKSDESRKNMQCEHCGKQFSPWQLTRHKRDVHGVGTPQAQFFCGIDQCGKTFQHLTKLKRHQKSHSKEDEPRTRSEKRVTLPLNEGSEAKIVCRDSRT